MESEEEKKFIEVADKIIDVFQSNNVPFSDCMHAIMVTLDFMFTVRKESKQEISRMVDNMKKSLLDLSDMPSCDSQPDKTQDEKKETIRKVLAAAKLEKTGLDRIVHYSSRFTKELYDSNMGPDEVFSILATMINASFAIFKIEKEDSEIVLSDIFNQIRNKL
jgi:hypothetical protein